MPNHPANAVDCPDLQQTPHWHRTRAHAPHRTRRCIPANSGPIRNLHRTTPLHAQPVSGRMEQAPKPGRNLPRRCGECVTRSANPPIPRSRTPFLAVPAARRRSARSPAWRNAGLPVRHRRCALPSSRFHLVGQTISGRIDAQACRGNSSKGSRGMQIIHQPMIRPRRSMQLRHSVGLIMG